MNVVGTRRGAAASLGLLCLLALLGASLPAAAEMEVYRPKHRTGQELAPLAETVLGEEGRVAVDPHTGALVLVGPAEDLAQALELLALQDRRLRMVLIQHEMRTLHDLQAAGFRVEWSAGGSSVRVGNVSRPGSGAAARIYDTSASARGSQAGVVNVLEGEWGRIAEGAEVLVPTGSWWYPGAERMSAESGLEVRPRVLGDGRVRLDLRPFQARLDRGGAVAYAGAATTLVVTPGETAVVGSIGDAGQGGADSATTGVVRSAGRRERLLLVTVSLDDAGEAGR